ncbi:MAG: hypothetical protein KF696_01150 [Planctomycetes bacterium]|nr:hypothetical protein [Planctomycetota bacterium]MCW8134454.1 hypothetical protein [Planctomycetota bacterium]
MKTHPVRCPQCSAMLDVKDGTSLIRCGFCRTPCHLDWEGRQPAASPEAEEFARLLGEIDLDAMEKSLDDLNEYLDEQQGHKRDLFQAAERLNNDATLEAMAQQVVRSGKAQEFLEGVNRLQIDESQEHEVRLREILSRVAEKMAVADDRQAETAYGATTPSAVTTRPRADDTLRPDFAALAIEEAATAELIRKLKLWRWLPWVGLLLVPVLVVGLAVIVTVVLAVALPNEAKGQWLTWLLAAGLFNSPVLGLAWLWFGLRRKKGLIRALSR